jgi:hypothetical protein
LAQAIWLSRPQCIKFHEAPRSPVLNTAGN